MQPQKNCSRKFNRRRGVVAAQVGVTMVVLLGCAALTIDVGNVYSARSELQRAADSAALAGASAFMSQKMMAYRQSGDSAAITEVITMASTMANNFSNMNPTQNSATLVAGGDIVAGNIDLASGTSPIVPGPGSSGYNAVHVLVKCEGADGGNAQVPLFFSGVFGRYFTNTSASAVAAFDDRFAGFTPDVPGARILPFTIHRDAFYQDFYNGPDDYAWNDTSGVTTGSSDGVLEVRLYPYPLSGSGYSDGDGNFGALNIGVNGQGASYEADQIVNGVSSQDLITEIGTSNPQFTDDSGSPQAYDITGSPGLTASLKAAVEQIIGEEIAFFLHDGVVLSGSNAIYNIVGMRFGRVMDIRLTGPPHQRGLFIQPITYVGGGVTVSPDAPSSNGEVGRLVLVR